MNVEEIIEEIVINTNITGTQGIFIESGAGNVVYNKLCQYPNTASKVVYYSESPNNWEYNKQKYNHGDVRAISKEVCQNMINYHTIEHPDKFILVNTIQIANDENTCSHGWFGYMNADNGIYSYFHYTIRGNKTRLEQLDIIAKIGLEIVLAEGNPHKNIIHSGYIDDFYSSFFETYPSMLSMLFNGQKMERNHCIVISKTAEIIRLEDYLRNNKEVNIFKGSFDPIHPEHLEIAKSKENTLLCISLNNRDTNKRTNIDNMMNRIKLIHSYGFDIMIDTKGFYTDSYELITSNTSYTDEHTLQYLLGSDTTERLINDTENDFEKTFSKAIFYNIQRLGINDFPKYFLNVKNYHIKSVFNEPFSSTTIRENIKNGTIDSLLEKINDKEYSEKLNKYYL